MDALVATIVNRPYVIAVVITFWVLAPAQLGWRRAGVWFVTGTFLGWLMEFSSTRTYFPFGGYLYHPDRFPDELWIGGVPPFASVSFAALTFFGYSAAVTLLGPLRRVDGDVVSLATERFRQSMPVAVLAAILPTWLDTIVDPVTHLGRYWMLGDLYHYDPTGMHFDVPLVNYAGWLFTCFLITRVNQLAWRSLPPQPAPYRLPMLPFWSVGALIGNMLFMLVVTVGLMRNPAVPPETPLQGILVSGVVLTAGFVAFAAVMVRRAFARAVPVPAGVTALPPRETARRSRGS
jgi:putative membrane protein